MKGVSDDVRENRLGTSPKLSLRFDPRYFNRGAGNFPVRSLLLVLDAARQRRSFRRKEKHMASQPAFHEANLTSTPIRDLGLTIAGTALEAIVADFEKELRQAGIRRVRPRFYLTTEWGVPFDTIAIGIPWYLARPELTALHDQYTGYVEGVSREDILRYLRHEMGHVINYAYRLYDEEKWIAHFGAITRPYEEDYRPEPFSRRFVRHLPGWYAQKHPDEDWAETFAIWMKPGLDWRTEYAGWATALAKLEYCHRTMMDLTDREPVVSATDLDEDVGELTYSIAKLYQGSAAANVEVLPGLDGALRTVFEDHHADEPAARQAAGALIRRFERDLLANVFRWTGHFPERTRVLLRHLADRADQLRQEYRADREAAVVVALTTLVTALAMNFVHLGSYFPGPSEKTRE